MTSQNVGSLNRDNLETPPSESWDKKPFGCGCREEAQNILYGGRWWLPPSLAVVSLESPVACPSTKGALEGELTNLLVGLMQVRISE